MEFEETPTLEGRIYWRWTSPGGKAAIKLPTRPGRTIKLTVEISKITPLPQLQALALGIGGETLPLRYMGRSELGFLFETIMGRDLLPDEGADIQIFNSAPRLCNRPPPTRRGDSRPILGSAHPPGQPTLIGLTRKWDRSKLKFCWCTDQ